MAGGRGGRHRHHGAEMPLMRPHRAAYRVQKKILVSKKTGEQRWDRLEQSRGEAKERWIPRL